MLQITVKAASMNKYELLNIHVYSFIVSGKSGCTHFLVGKLQVQSDSPNIHQNFRL